MRVTMLVRCLAMMRGGGETRHLAWARELTAIGVDVHVVTGRPLVGAARFHDAPPEATVLRSPYARDFVYRFQQRRGFGRLTMTALHIDEEWFCRAAWSHIASMRTLPDVVHAHALHQAARLRRGDVPVVIHLPGPPNPRYVEDLHKADALVADGWAADHLPAQIGRPVERVPKGVDAQLFRPDGPNLRQPLRLEGRRVVLTVARLVPIKNVGLLVDAVALLRRTDPAVHLLVVGDGPEAAALRARAARLGLDGAITWAGAVPFEQTPAFYRSADLFVLASSFDNSPNAVLEAMASGLPVVATGVGGAADFIAQPAGGAIIASDDAPALSAAMERFLDPDIARAAGEYNRRRAAANYSWRASALRLHDVYEQVVAARRGADRVSA